MMSKRPNQLAIVVTITAALVAIALGGAVTQYPATYLFALAGLAAAVIIARWNRGVFVGILVLLILDGIPFITTQAPGQHGSGGVYDAIFLVLTLYLVGCLFDNSHRTGDRRLTRLVLAWAGVYLAWWSFKVFAASADVPLIPAIKYGRIFLYFIVFLPLALVVLHKRQHLIGFALTLTVGACLFSVGQILQQLTHADFGWLIHITQANEFEGITRIYAPMNDLVIAAFPMAFGAALIGPARWRRAAIFVALLTGFANALSFTRAVYLSEIVALLIISLIWAQGLGRPSRRIRYMPIIAMIVVAFVLVAADESATTSTPSSSPVQAVVSRAVLGINDLKTGEGTAGYRLRESRLELEALGPHWVAGLGFLNPSYHYIAGLREGAIQNTDLGSLSILMTMGTIGLVLAYIPPIAGLIYLLRRRNGYIQYGGAIYLLAAIIGSITLGAVSTLPGLVVLGSMLALCINATRQTAIEMA